MDWTLIAISKRIYRNISQSVHRFISKNMFAEMKNSDLAIIIMGGMLGFPAKINRPGRRVMDAARSFYLFKQISLYILRLTIENVQRNTSIVSSAISKRTVFTFYAVLPCDLPSRLKERGRERKKRGNERVERERL